VKEVCGSVQRVDDETDAGAGAAVGRELLADYGGLRAPRSHRPPDCPFGVAVYLGDEISRPFLFPDECLAMAKGRVNHSSGVGCGVDRDREKLAN